MGIVAILVLGFFLGMRHATDADHVAAVSTIVTRERSLRSAVPVGVLWGLGHTVTILLVGGAIVLLGLVISPRVGLGMEMSVAVMLVLLGGMNLHAIWRDVRGHRSRPDGAAALPAADVGPPRWRPLLVGVVHGLAGSAAVALLVLGTIRDSTWAVAYLVVFGVGTIAGMALITAAMAAPLAVAAQRFAWLHRGVGVVSCVLSVGLGAFLVYEIGFAHGLFTPHPQWTPE